VHKTLSKNGHVLLVERTCDNKLGNGSGAAGQKFEPALSMEDYKDAIGSATQP